MGGKGSGRPIPIPRGSGGRFKGNGPCFIASAVYGDPQAPEVCTLRRFRDERLMTHAVGRAAVAFYYATSPPVAFVLSRSPRASLAVRKVLDAIVDRVEPRG